MKDKPIPGFGETCPCGRAMFNRIARCNESTDGLSLQYDVCPACGFETYACSTMAVKRERFMEWVDYEKLEQARRWRTEKDGRRVVRAFLGLTIISIIAIILKVTL